uniref:Uncharacterized protein n=1 Tax=Ditylenchus dipsaci TaxID=166011 RepID=A0A915CYZ0_9BILA
MEPYECEIKGEIPKWLSVTLLRNGPGKFKFGDTEFRHWFDGMSFIQRFHFKTQKCFSLLSTYRVIVTKETRQLIESRYFTYYLGSEDYTDNCVVNFLTYTLDKANLSKCISLHTCSAHHHYDNQHNIFNIGMRFGRKSSYVFVKTEHCSDDDSKKQLENSKLIEEIPLIDQKNPSYMHSFAMTENYLVVFEAPLKMNLLKILTVKFTSRTFQDCIKWHDNDFTYIHVFNHKTGQGLNVVFKWISNCGLLCLPKLDLSMAYLDNIRKSNEVASKDISMMPFLKRMVIPLNIAEDTQIGTDLLKFSRYNYNFNAKGYTFLYGASLAPENNQKSFLIKTNPNTKTYTKWEADTLDQSCTEPVFVSKPGATHEDDGVILSAVLTFDEHSQSYMVVLDAKTFKEIARCYIKEKFL